MKDVRSLQYDDTRPLKCKLSTSSEIFLQVVSELKLRRDQLAGWSPATHLLKDGKEVDLLTSFHSVDVPEIEAYADKIWGTTASRSELCDVTSKYYARKCMATMLLSSMQDDLRQLVTRTINHSVLINDSRSCRIRRNSEDPS